MKKISGTENRFITFLFVATIALILNLIATHIAGYASTFSDIVYAAGITLTIIFRFTYKAGYHLATLFVCTLFFNVFFTIFSYLYGLKSLIGIYYFPFLVSFIYMFKDQYTKGYALSFIILCIAFVSAQILFCPMNPASENVTDAQTNIMYKKNFIIAFSLSFYYFYTIFSFMINQNKDLLVQKEIAEEALKAKARFLSVMSHELRTPLNGIIGMINLMNTPEGQKDGKKFLQILKTSSQHLLHLVNNVLDYSKASAGKMELTPVTCRVDEILQNLYDVFRPRFLEKNIAFELSIDSRIKENVLIDDIRFVQVMTNLLSNALKFTDEGKVSLTATCLHTTKDAQEIQISVADTGRGISKDQQAQIFDSFNNINNKSRTAESSGLGLSISKMIIELMKGNLQLESQEGKGSRFYFNIMVPKAVPEKEVMADTGTAETVSLEGMTVLVAEDNPINLIIAREFLKRWKINILEAPNGLIAQKQIQNHPDIDLILLDIQMPEMDGYEVMAWIKENSIPIPTIAFTANMLAAEEKKELLNQGFFDMVPKPFSPADLEEKMKKAVRKKYLMSTAAS